MKLNPEYFEMIKTGKKKIEIRLLDEKRRKVRIGDTIEFSKRPELKDNITVSVKGIKKYANYEQLVENTPHTHFGGNYKDKSDILKKGCPSYSKEQQEEYRFIVFEIELL